MIRTNRRERVFAVKSSGFRAQLHRTIKRSSREKKARTSGTNDRAIGFNAIGFKAIGTRGIESVGIVTIDRFAAIVGIAGIGSRGRRTASVHGPIFQ